MKSMTCHLRPITCLLIIPLILWSWAALAQTSPEPAAKKGTLSILSDPGGAKVFINETLQGKTPLHLTLPVGNYNLRLEKTGYKPITEKIVIQEGEDTALDVELEEIE